MAQHDGAVDVAIKRAYDEAEPADGTRVLIDRLWPRGVSKEKAKIDLWLKDVAPSAELRTWYGHDPAKFDEFRRRYLEELAREPGKSGMAKLREMAEQGPVTLVFAARDAAHANATVLRALLAKDS